jgi:hypothetical protein
VIRQSSADNSPQVSITTSAIDLVPCWPSVAFSMITEDKRSLVCRGVLPVINFEIFLDFQFSNIRGSFDLESLGSLPAQDCWNGKAPIDDWSDDLDDNWYRVTGNAAGGRECGSMTDTPLSTPITTVDQCKSECLIRPGCNLIASLPVDSGGVASCSFYRCPDPSKVSFTHSDDFEVWSHIADDGRQRSGYVAFGVPDRVIHGGCASPNGFIQNQGRKTTVTIPETTVRYQNSIRWQISQYNAEARVRISNIQLELFVRNQPNVLFHESYFTPAGSDPLAGNSRLGSPSGPIQFTDNGNGLVFTTIDGIEKIVLN